MTAAAVQFDLWSASPPRAAMSAHPLRPYQTEAYRRIGGGWAAHRSQLVVLPTGTGKTRLFSEVAKDWPGKVLVIAHRDELISQARAALERNCGELVSTEKAEQRAEGTRIVVASVQSLRGDRLASLTNRHPASLIITDEAHHAVSPGYQAVYAAFGEAKHLGVTATPDRADEAALGQVFDSVAFVYEIQDAIRDGFLCGIRVWQVVVGDIDLSNVGTVAGDLNQGELDAVMQAEQVLHGIAKPLVEVAGDRRTIVFCTSVEAAHRMAEVINRYRPDQARAVDGETARDTRKLILRDHSAGRYQYLCNVGVLTEGYDDPGVACVAMARPTKSRALYAQCAGRGLRILEGKADCLLLDFVGNSGRHRLCSGLDILAGKYDDEVVALAEKKAQQGDILAEEALEEAQREIEAQKAREAARRLRVTARKVEHVVIERDPFALLDVENPDADERYARYRAEATPGQVAALERFKVPDAAKLSKRQAGALLDKLIGNARAGLATYKQVAQLKKRGIDASGVTFEQASKVMDWIASHGWRTPPGDVVASIVQRVPGQEG